MAVEKTFEWPLLLYVGEVMVPFELRDQGDPTGAKRQEGNEAKRSDDFRASAGERRPVRDRGSFFRDSRWWHQFEADQFSPSLRRHDARKISGVGKKQEYLLDRRRHPLFELNPVSHKI